MTYKINATFLIPLACVVHRKPRIFSAKYEHIRASELKKKSMLLIAAKPQELNAAIGKYKLCHQKLKLPAEEKIAECGLIATIK